jgi:CRP-like cAMP-binding protein
MDARAQVPSDLVRIDAASLDLIVEQTPEVGAKLFAGLWKLLADQLRDANARFKTYVVTADDKTIRSDVSIDAGATAIRVPFGDKVELFREQGLTREELVTLAAFAKERRFGAGAYLFREGDPGSEMYVIVEGRVRISQFLPGAGEEALAVLSRGDFFGEMALIDGRARSADARTHEGPVTALALDRGTLREVLSLDPAAAVQFLRLLCRILAARLREVDEKLLLWELLSRQQRST